MRLARTIHATLLSGLTATMALALAQAPAQNLAAPTDPTSQLTNASSSTSLGWRLFQAKCATCHGPDATGTERAPNLLPRVEEMNQRKFTNVVLRRYDWTVQSSDVGGMREALIEDVLQRKQGNVTMPAWESEPSVEANIIDLFAYLKARAAGTLGPGRPAQ